MRRQVANLIKIFNQKASARALLFGAFVGVLALLPMKGSPRLLVSADVLKELDLERQAPIGPVYGPEPQTYKVIVDFDTAYSRGAADLRSIKEGRKDLFLEKYRDDIKRYPYRFTKTLAFPIGTYARKNSCVLRLVLDGRISSREVPCKNLQDNDLARFEFPGLIPPGIYSAQLYSSAASSSDGVAPYVRKDAKGDMWIIPHSWPVSTNSAEAFVALAAGQPLHALLYALAICLLGGLFIFGAGSLRSLVLCVAVTAGVVMLATKPMSGHDETAHITMLFMATQGLNELPTNLKNTSMERFFSEVSDYMYDNDFYRMHNVRTIPRGACPHAILNSCGVSDSPAYLYKFYAAVLSIGGFHPSKPAEIEHVGKAANILLTLLIFCLILLLYGNDVTHASLFLLALTGGFLAQFASITNDIPQYLMGFFALGTACYIFLGKSQRKALVGVAVLLVLFAIAFPIDRSSLSLLPLLLALVIFMMIRLSQGRSLIVEERDGHSNATVLLAAGCFTAGAVAAIAGLNLLPGIVRLSPLSSLGEGIAQSTNLRMILNFPLVDLGQAAVLLGGYLQSVFGTFVWGHSFYHGIFYFIFAAACTGLAVWGIRSLKGTVGWKTCAFSGLMLGVLVAALAGIVVSIAAPYIHAHPIARDSFTKARLTAPAIAVFWLVPAIGYLKMGQSQWFRSASFRALVVWQTIFVAYYLPRFYFGDLF